MKKNLLLGCAATAGIFIIGLLGLLIYLNYLGNWYEQVRAAMPEVEQKLIALNHAAILQIPPPKGITEIDRKDYGVNTIIDYGVTTDIEYKVNDPELDIRAYYRSMMEALHWKLWRSYIDHSITDWYYFDNTCLEIIIYPEEKEYSTSIFHDFSKQSFSPELPPMWYVQGIREAGKTHVATCPWQ